MLNEMPFIADGFKQRSVLRHDLFPYFRTPAEMPCPVNWADFFGNDRPVELDIGCGRGMFLVNAGLSHPERNFLGIELD
jgi:tRNA (guanine-N7-)-methyltransferase